ncbi:MAG: hypothetical protein J0L73_28315 [Verrucomicrobia bacterium]|nr:hypothetical protein [Verrucomicrobiota bacterium]
MKYACALLLITCVIMGFFVLDARRQSSPDPAKIKLRMEHKPEYGSHVYSCRGMEIRGGIRVRW